MSIQEYNFPIFFNSSAETGALPVGILGNEFSVQLNNPIVVPRNAINCTVEISSASIWNSSPNIADYIGNNKIYFTYLSVPHIIQIPNGLYGSEDIDSLIGIYFSTNGLPRLFEISSNEATQRVIIVFNNICVIDFTQVRACSDVLGFNNVVGPYATFPTYVTAPNTARFNRVEKYYIISNLISGGIPQNSTSSGILARIPINVRNNSMINYEPLSAVRCDGTELIGMAKQVINFRLVDQLLRNLSTFDEDWSFCLNIRYYLKV